MSIFVGNLPFRAEQEDIIELFASFGEVTNCSLPLERDTGRKRGFAFIEMADEATEERAIEGLQGTELMGRPLRINKAEPRGSRDGGGGGYGGGGGRGGYGGGGGRGGYGGGSISVPWVRPLWLVRPYRSIANRQRTTWALKASTPTAWML